LSASSDKRICLWDIETGDLMKEYKGHQKAITSIDLFPKTTTTIQND
jgi:WD40 repeat protein